MFPEYIHDYNQIIDEHYFHPDEQHVLNFNFHRNIYNHDVVHEFVLHKFLELHDDCDQGLPVRHGQDVPRGADLVLCEQESHVRQRRRD